MSRALIAVAAFSVLPGCGVALMQSAKTTPYRKARVTLANGVMVNEMVAQRGMAPGNYPSYVGLRYGAGRQWDTGASLFMGTGALWDAKWNLLPADGPTALSLYGGLGGAANFGADSNGGGMVHLPLRVLFSHELAHGLTPYGGVGYGAFWVLGYTETGHTSWHGDGVLLTNLGVELPLGGPVALLAEYDLWQPVMDEKADDHAFAQNHVFSVGVRL